MDGSGERSGVWSTDCKPNAQDCRAYYDAQVIMVHCEFSAESTRKGRPFTEWHH